MPDRLSVVMTAHNEGDEVRKTIDSIRTASSIPCSICVIDDASTDACCDGVASDDIQVIRHDQRSGVARSRREGV
ncbi:MAG: glycosyltransferase family 2 protein, partial [Planctomycetes bacterium]|nr:glycosyltransferase family 2 protein [Planctomycetota bacterium]